MERNILIPIIDIIDRSEEPSYEFVQVKDDLGDLIGHAAIYSNPSELSAIGWSQALNVHIMLEDPDSIAMDRNDRSMISIGKRRIQEIRKLEPQLRMDQIMGLAFKAIGSSKVAITYMAESTS